MWFRFLLLGVLSMMSSCKTDEDDGDKAWHSFVAQYAHVYCDIRSSCDNDFEAEFGGQEQCRKAVLTNENKGSERREENGCTFEKNAALDCLDAAETMICSEWLSGALDESCGSALWSCD